MTINTVARSVEKESIHRNCQRAKVKSPAISRNSEYHKRVSPMVRSGGRSRVIHSVAIKSTKMRIAVPLQAIAMPLRSLLRSAVTAEVSDSTKTAAATHGNMFHPNSILLYVICCVVRTTNKEHYSTHKQHYDARQR